MAPEGKARRWGSLIPWMGLPFAVSSLVCFARATPREQGPVIVERPEEDLWLFGVRLDQRLLSSALPAFPVKDGFLLPLGEFCRVLDLAIQVDPGRGSAEGFIIEEKRRFSLNVATATVAFQGVRQPFAPAGVEVHTDDIYVDSRLLATWLPIGIQVTRRTAMITLIAREALPLQQRWLRELGLGLARAGPELRVFPKFQDPYRLLEVPCLDASIRVTTASQAPSNTDHRTLVQLTTLATGDLLGLSTSIYANVGSQGGLGEFRMTLGRRDPDAALLGPLRATEFAVGEVLSPGIDLATQAFSGTGVLLTNFSPMRENSFDRHNFQGVLAPGWQVELYRSHALLAFQASRPDGRYEFLNVFLFYGLNDFLLVFYGPQGQRREEAVRFDVSASQTPVGTFQYRLMGDDPRIVGTRKQFEGRYGLTEQISGSLDLAQVAFNGNNHTYSVAGLQGFWKPLSGSVSAARDALGGVAEELDLRTRIGPVNLNAKHADLQGGFTSEVFNPVYGLIQSRNVLEAMALLTGFQRYWFTVDLTGSQDRIKAGGAVYGLSSRLSASCNGLFFSNEIIRTEVRGGATEFPATTTGELLASKFFPAYSIRAQADYGLSGSTNLQGCLLMVETPICTPLLLRASLARTLADRDTTLLVGATKSQGTYSLSLDVSYSTLNRLLVDLTLHVGLLREPRHGRIQAQAQGMSGQGALSARVFLDSNGNGRPDPGEPGLAKAGLQVNGVGRADSTDATGVALLTGLAPDQDANLAVAASSLEDPLMRPGPGIRVTPRQGHVTRVDFPVGLYGEVNGTVFRQGDDGSREVPGLSLELAAKTGKAVRTVRTAYDGFFTFPEVPPGAYQLRVAEAEARRFHLVAPAPKEVVIAPDGTVIDGLDLTLSPAAARPEEKP